MLKDGMTFLILNGKIHLMIGEVYDIRFLQGGLQMNSQKPIPLKSPLPLYERIIRASSNQGDVVLDPFCGSGTTLRAAKTLGRKYIGIDQNPEAIRISENRLNPPQQELFTA